MSDSSNSQHEEDSTTEQVCDTLRRQRRTNETPYEDLADTFDITITTVLQHVKGRCQHTDGEEDPVDDQPWRERAVMHHLFVEERRYFTQMSDLLGCHDETARNWVGKHDLSPDDTHHTSSKLVRRLQHMDVDPHGDIDKGDEEETTE